MQKWASVYIFIWVFSEVASVQGFNYNPLTPRPPYVAHLYIEEEALKTWKDLWRELVENGVQYQWSPTHKENDCDASQQDMSPSSASVYFRMLTWRSEMKNKKKIE